MKRAVTIVFILGIIFLSSGKAEGQCSVCTKTALQMGEKPAQGLNQGIIYLMMAPFIIVGVIGYRWWKRNGKAG